MSISEQSMAAGVLASLQGMTPTRLRIMFDGCTDPLSLLQAIDKGEYTATYAQRWKGKCGPDVLEGLRRICDNSGVGIETLNTAYYPSRLRFDGNAPAVIFYNGDPTVLNRTQMVCVVGTRSASPYGMKIAYEIGFALAQAGITVVSGLAAGIDAAAHRGAVDAIRRLLSGSQVADQSDTYGNTDFGNLSSSGENDTFDAIPGSDARSCPDDHEGSYGSCNPDSHSLPVYNNSVDGIIHEDVPVDKCGSVVAVMAGGPDISYPAKNQDIFRAATSCGVVISELPPGMPASRWRFVARNRIMAAMSSLVVVVESHAEGGSLHTVHQAEIRDIPVAAVPGAVTSLASHGCNELIKSRRAHLVTGADDIIDLLRSTVVGSGSGHEEGKVSNKMPAVSMGCPGSKRQTVSCPLPVASDPSSKDGAYQDHAGRDHMVPNCDEISSRLEGHARLPGIEEGVLYSALEQLSVYPLTLDEIVMRLGSSVGRVSLCLEQLEDIGLAKEYAGCWMRS